MKSTDTSGDDLMFALRDFANSQGYHPFQSSGNLVCGFGWGSGHTVNTNVLIADGNWHNIACVVNASKWQWIYKDSVLLDNRQLITPYEFINQTLIIGGNQFGNFFNGSIDEVAIYNRSLSASEVYELYNRLKGQFQSKTI
ncbi:LamG domain-containing protein, partial [Candidatus Woesearchaeota archaeon]|nr:LamG domain-containing protein [Candidatus Woesearchaeota archaeon]